jgi:nucleoside-diphosphate-sugar epimerase
MKLVIGGSTGFVGVELVRQALSNPAITSVVALSRRETPLPPEAGPDSTKLRSLVCDNFESYSDRIKKELEDADACIWWGLPLVRPVSFLLVMNCQLWFPARMFLDLTWPLRNRLA